MRRVLLSLVLLAVCAGSAAAQTMGSGKGIEPPLPGPLAEQKKRGAQVYYLGKYDVLDGWVLIRTGQPEFYYSTPGGNAVVMGFLFDKSGELITNNQLGQLQISQETGLTDMMASQMPAEEQQPPAQAQAPAAQAQPPAAALPEQVPAQAPRAAEAQAVPAPAPQQIPPAAAAAPAAAPQAVASTLVPNTPAEKFFAEVQAGNSVLLGDASKPTFYAFIDPNCPHCQHFMTAAEARVNAGEIAIRALPVGFDETSKRQAAFVLAAGDGAQRLMAYSKGDANQLPAPADIGTQGVSSNVAILSNWNLMVTPVIVYRSAVNGEVKLIRGRPLDMDGAVADLRGQP